MIRLFRDILIDRGGAPPKPLVTKITYQKAFTIGPYLQEKIGVEVELNYNTPDQAFEEAKRLVEKWGAKAEESFNFSMGGIQMQVPITPQPLQSIDPKKRDETEIAIDNAETFAQLDELYDDCNKYGLLPQYRAKRDSLPSNQ